MPRDPASRAPHEPGAPDGWVASTAAAWRDALALGAAVGAVEVALRADPARGWTTADTLRLLAASMGCACLVSVLATACVLPLLRRRPTRGGTLPWACATLLAVVAATLWRDTFAVNAFLRDPRAWGGILGFGAAGAWLGAWFGAYLAPRRATAALAVVAPLAALGLFVRQRPRLAQQAPLLVSVLATGVVGAEIVTGFVQR